MEIYPNVFCLPVTTATVPPHTATNTYFLMDGDKALLIDAVRPTDDGPLDHFAGKGIREVVMAAITHCHGDHHIGLAKILERFGGKAVCHKLTQEYIEDQLPDVEFGPSLEDGQLIEFGEHRLRVLNTKGHCPDHLCFYLEGARILFSGDTILGHGTTIISPPQGDMIDYMASLERLAQLELDMICTAHGPLIQEKPVERIKWYISHRMMRENKIIDALKDGPLTAAQIAKRIYTEEDFKMHGPDLLPRAERAVMAHMVKLEKEGKSSSTEQNNQTIYNLL